MDDKTAESHATQNETPSLVISNYARHRREVYLHQHGGQELMKEYDVYAAHYNKNILKNGYVGVVSLVDVFCDFISDTSLRILDTAAGTGLVGKELKRRGFNCIDALDPSQESLEQSKRDQIYNEYICDTIDAEHQTTIPDDQYDAIVMGACYGVPGHVTEACFPEFIRMIKPGGYFMFTVGEKVLNECNDKMDAAISSLSQQGLWELKETRWVPYYKAPYNEKAKIPVLKILKQ